MSYLSIIHESRVRLDGAPIRSCSTAHCGRAQRYGDGDPYQAVRQNDQSRDDRVVAHRVRASPSKDRSSYENFLEFFRGMSLKGDHIT